MEENSLHNNAVSPKMMTYKDIAQALGIARGTLGRELRDCAQKGIVIQPDKKEDHGNFTVHLFNPERVGEFQAALESLGKKRRRK